MQNGLESTRTKSLTVSLKHQFHCDEVMTCHSGIPIAPGWMLCAAYMSQLGTIVISIASVICFIHDSVACVFSVFLCVQFSLVCDDVYEKQRIFASIVKTVVSKQFTFTNIINQLKRKTKIK